MKLRWMSLAISAVVMGSIGVAAQETGAVWREGRTQSSATAGTGQEALTNWLEGSAQWVDPGEAVQRRVRDETVEKGQQLIIEPPRPGWLDGAMQWREREEPWQEEARANWWPVQAIQDAHDRLDLGEGPGLTSCLGCHTRGQVVDDFAQAHPFNLLNDFLTDASAAGTRERGQDQPSTSAAPAADPVYLIEVTLFRIRADISGETSLTEDVVVESRAVDPLARWRENADMLNNARSETSFFAATAPRSLPPGSADSDAWRESLYVYWMGLQEMPEGEREDAAAGLAAYMNALQANEGVWSSNAQVERGYLEMAQSQSRPGAPRLGIDPGSEFLTDFWAPRERFNFFTQAELKIGSMEFVLDENGARWDGQALPSKQDEATMLTSPKLMVRAGEPANLTIGSANQLQYFEPREGGGYDLKTHWLRPGLQLDITVKPHPDAPGQRVMVEPFNIAVSSIQGREAVDGVTLDVGRPIVDASEANFTLDLELGRAYAMQWNSKTQGVLLMIVEVSEVK